MSHHARIRSVGDGWLTILPTELEALEQGLASGINGDDGSTHAPSAPITFQGVFGLMVTGPTLVTMGAGLYGPNDGSSGTIAFDNSDWGSLDPSNVLATRVPFEPMERGRGLPSYTWTTRRENGSLQAYAPMVDIGDGAGMRQARAYVPFAPHDGSTVTSLTVFFHVGAVHTAVPPVMPSVRVVRQDSAGNCVPLTSVAAGGDVAGYVFVATPSSATAWTNNFQTQSLTLKCDQNNVIDRSQYDYFLELVEEGGLTGYPWQLVFVPPVALVATTANVSLYNLPFVDGVDLSDGSTGTGGDIVLVKNQTDSRQNGLYVTSLYTWTRLPDAPFSQGMVVPVLAGTVNGGTMWQASSNVSSWTPSDPVTLTWAPSTAFNVNALVTPTRWNGLYYTSGSGGTSSSTEPHWPLAPGATVTDGSVTWTCVGAAIRGDQLDFVPVADGPPSEGSALFGHGISWHGFLPTYAAIPDLRPA